MILCSFGLIYTTLELCHCQWRLKKDRQYFGVICGFWDNFNEPEYITKISEKQESLSYPQIIYQGYSAYSELWK